MKPIICDLSTARVHTFESSIYHDRLHDWVRGNCFLFQSKWVVAVQIDINILRPRQNGRHFADDIFKCIFLNENIWIPVKISLKYVPKGPINNIPTFVQIMAWRRSGDKPLSKPMMVGLPAHICVTRPQWVNGPVCGRRDTETLSTLLSLYEGNPPTNDGFPHKGPVIYSFDVFLFEQAVEQTYETT